MFSLARPRFNLAPEIIGCDPAINQQLPAGLLLCFCAFFGPVKDGEPGDKRDSDKGLWMNGVCFLQLSKLREMLVESDAQQLIVIVK